MTPIKVTATMGEPIIYYGYGLHFDGLLAWSMYRQGLRDERVEEVSDPDHQEFPQDFDLPLDTWTSPVESSCDLRLTEEGQIWGWRASAIQWPGHYLESSHALRKMTNVDQLVRHTDAARHKMSTGLLKGKDKTFPTRFAHRVWWYAVGNIDGVRECLRDLTHIGKLHNLGMGRVQEWAVETIEADYSLVKDGETTRCLPTGIVDSKQIPERASIRPPYSHPSRMVDAAYAPGTGVIDAVG